MTKIAEALARVGTDIDALVKNVVDKKIEVDISIEPDRIEITIRPWEPYRPTCPYKE